MRNASTTTELETIDTRMVARFSDATPTEFAFSAPPSSSNPLAIQPKTFSEVREMSDYLSKSTFIPTAFIGKPGDITAAILKGAEIGIYAMQALECISVINGRACLWGDTMLALVKASPTFLDIVETVKNDVATCTVSRKNQTSVTHTFSMEDATRARLIARSKGQGPWSTYPNRMLQMRARGFALRDMFPDILRGIRTVEEVRDEEWSNAKKVQDVSNPALSSVDQIKQKIKADSLDNKISDPISDHVFPEGQLLVEGSEIPVSLTHQKLLYLVKFHNISDDDCKVWLEKAQVETLSELSEDQALKCVEYIGRKSQAS